MAGFQARPVRAEVVVLSNSDYENFLFAYARHYHWTFRFGSILDKLGAFTYGARDTWL